MPTTFDLYPVIDLTVAHANLKITTVRPLRFLQFWCDGVLDGISVNIGDQNVTPIQLNQMVTIPIYADPDTIYISNDVRQGRSALVVYFVHTGEPLQLTIGGQSITQAEVAARLGSRDYFDRRGEVIFSSQDKKALTPPYLITITQAGTGGSATVSSAKGKSGARSIKLVTGNGNTDDTLLQIPVPYVSLSRHALELSFDITTVCLYSLSLSLYNGTRYYIGKVTYNPATTTLAIQRETGAMVAIDAALALGTFSFHTIKLVVDFGLNKYVRLIVDQKTYDLSNYGLYSLASAAAPLLYAQADIQTLAVVSKTMYVDDILITKNEP